MQHDYKATAKTFYTLFGEKDLETMKAYLHPDVEFTSPMTKRQGIDDYLGAAQQFASFFEDLSIRSLFSAENQVVVVYEATCPAPVGSIPTVALLTFQEGLISKIELFFDASSFR